jgi:hypothetical protein
VDAKRAREKAEGNGFGPLLQFLVLAFTNLIAGKYDACGESADQKVHTEKFGQHRENEADARLDLNERIRKL